jgi:hypothetical protein
MSSTVLAFGTSFGLRSLVIGVEETLCGGGREENGWGVVIVIIIVAAIIIHIIKVLAQIIIGKVSPITFITGTDPTLLLLLLLSLLSISGT